jgi:predicted nicotinamide N-methyase
MRHEPISTPFRFGNLEVVGSKEGPDGSKLWPCSVALATCLAGIDCANLRAVEVGCGLGLPGMTVALRGAKVTLIEQDESALPWLLTNLCANEIRAKVIPNSWQNIEGQFDLIVGSEVLYRQYGQRELTNFIKRCWTKKGPCLFFNQRYETVSEFINGLEQAGLTYSITETLHYLIWEIH